MSVYIIPAVTQTEERSAMDAVLANLQKLYDWELGKTISLIFVLCIFYFNFLLDLSIVISSVYLGCMSCYNARKRIYMLKEISDRKEFTIEI